MIMKMVKCDDCKNMNVNACYTKKLWLNSGPYF